MATKKKPAAKIYKAPLALVEPVASEAGQDARRLRFTITTDQVDRDNDTVSAKGWRLDNYLKNPTVLWAHDYRVPPLAKTVNIVQTGSALVAEAEFTPKGMNPFADTIYDMLRGGFLKATSVGFKPLKWLYNEERKGYDFHEQELLEFSIVPVPSNPNAVMELRSANGPLAKAYAEQMREWAEGVLKDERDDMDDEDAPHPMTCPREDCPMKDQKAVLKPMPEAGDSESEREFMARCMADERMNTEYPDPKQRAAVCYAQWDKAVAVRIEKQPLIEIEQGELVDLDFEVPDPAGFEIDEAAVLTVARGAICEAISTAVGLHVRETLRQMSGRVD